MTSSTYRFALRAEPLYWLKDGEPLDHNVCERAIKNVILGRKSWLLAVSPGAGKHTAQIMSLLETAKRNGLEPHAWLADVLKRLPSWLEDRPEELLPLPGFVFSD